MDTTNTTQGDLLRFLKEKLAASGIDEATEESERILEDVLGVTKTDLYMEPAKEVAPDAGKRSLKILEGREKRTPLAYLLGEADFWQETLFVDYGCLVPRPETEILVEAILQTVHKKTHPIHFLDIGTGSGAIAIALLRTLNHAHGTMLDISNKALEVARRNIEKYKLQDRTRLVEGDLFLPFTAGEKWDLIVSNPPYLSEKDLLAGEPELKTEPRVALDGGKDGLDVYRRMIPEAKHYLKAGGMLALELGAGQAETVSKWLQEAGYDNIQRSRDYLGIDRVILARKSITKD